MLAVAYKMVDNIFIINKLISECFGNLYCAREEKKVYAREKQEKSEEKWRIQNEEELTLFFKGNSI